MNSYWTEYPVLRGNDTIDDLWPIIEGRGYLAGSFAAWMCSRLERPWLPNDIDIFATSMPHARDIVRALCQSDWATCSLTNVQNIAAMLRHTACVITENDTAISVHRRDGLTVQVVKPSPKWKDWPSDLLDSFDMDVCRAILVGPRIVMADVNAGGDTAKILRTNNPLRTLKRVTKYQARGITFLDHELLKLFRAWDAIPQMTKDDWIERAARERPDVGVYEGDDDDTEPYNFHDDDDWFEGE